MDFVSFFFLFISLKFIEINSNVFFFFDFHLNFKI